MLHILQEGFMATNFARLKCQWTQHAVVSGELRESKNLFATFLVLGHVFRAQVSCHVIFFVKDDNSL